MTAVSPPQFTDSVTTQVFLEPLNGARHPSSYLDRFPEALYNKTLDSHFMRFMYTLLGPVGIGLLKRNFTHARLRMEASGLTLFSLDDFYSDPFSFGRILTEAYFDDISSLLPAGVWSQIIARDEQYRTRAIQFMNAARLGTSPDGMRLAATSGAGQPCNIVENYRYLFDFHSDDRLFLLYQGASFYNTAEFIISPQPTTSVSQQQVLDFTLSEIPLDGGNFNITYNGFTCDLLDIDNTPDQIQAALYRVPTIGVGNVNVTGSPFDQLVLSFTGQMSNQVLKPVQCNIVNDVFEPIASVPVTIFVGGVVTESEPVVISEVNQYEMQVAIDYLRPVASYPSFRRGRGLLKTQQWTAVLASSENSQVIRYVTGNRAVAWPPLDATHWITPDHESEALQTAENASQHYVGFHNVANIVAYSDTAEDDPSYDSDQASVAAYNSVHVGPFPELDSVMPYFNQFADTSLVYTADRALADYTEPLTMTTLDDNGVAYINDIYPSDYADLAGVPQIKYRDDQFWSSRERPFGAEILEIDLGVPQAVNFISLETSYKPVTVSIDYELLDRFPARRFAPIIPNALYPYDNNVFYTPSSQNPWAHLTFLFDDGDELIFTRLLRLTFTRRGGGSNGQFLYDTSTGVQTPWSIDVRNLRIGRNIAPAVV